MVHAEAVFNPVEIELKGADVLCTKLNIEWRMTVIVRFVNGRLRLDMIAIVGATHLGMVQSELVVEGIVVGGWLRRSWFILITTARERE